VSNQYNVPRLIVTGSSGFIGGTLTETLARAGHEVLPVTRSQITTGVRPSVDPSLASTLVGSDVVIHLAARAHVIRENHDDPLREFRRVNLDGTLATAKMAAKAGVSRFVFVSSIGVLGNSSGSRAFKESDQPAPQEPYAISKWEAERALREFAKDSSMQVVIVRPPLVYGPNVKGNFLRLLRLVWNGTPLPFGAIRNSRSFVGVQNLCDFLMCCALHPAAANRTFHVADGEDVSTVELLSMIAPWARRRVYSNVRPAYCAL
jgi:UDP-N-acetyl-alpha-D-quinovosamine dehydrogenase